MLLFPFCRATLNRFLRRIEPHAKDEGHEPAGRSSYDDEDAILERPKWHTDGALAAQNAQKETALPADSQHRRSHRERAQPLTPDTCLMVGDIS